MIEDKKVSRRKFLKIAGGAAGLGVAACGASAYFGMQTPAHVVFPYVTCGSPEGKKVLVAYASRAGTTGEIAAQLSKVLCDAGFAVDLRHVRDVDAIDEYQAAVIGSPVYMGRVMGECLSFIEGNSVVLQNIQTAFFGVGLTMKEDTLENRGKMAAFFQPAVDMLKPAYVDYFAGRIKLENLPFIFRMFAQADPDGILAEGDYRDWAAIKNWGADMSAAFI